MPTTMVYLLMLGLGVALLVIGNLLDKVLKIALFLMGVVLIAFGAYGVFTSFF